MKKILGFLLCCLLVLLNTAIPFQITQAQFFKDLNEEHPFYDAINYLHQHGILQGYSDQTFRPDQKINRAETLKILLLGSNISVAESVTNGGFYDVPTDAWFAPFINKGKQIGIIKGNPNGSFAPERTVNLAEALKMIINTNGFMVEDVVNGAVYPDVSADVWFASYFSYAQENHFLNADKNTKIYPSQEMTRGYLADLMYRAIIHKKETEQDQKYASYYSDDFNGRNTSSGDVFDNNKLTAAHRTLPFGTLLRVINVNNGKSVIVTVNDRGPHKEDRIIDLTAAAFESIGSLSSGILPVVIEVIDGNTGIQLADNIQNCQFPSERNIIATDFYDHIQLDTSSPTLFIKNELHTIRGKVKDLSDIKQVTATLFLNDKQITSYTADINKDQSFSLPVLLEQEGNFNFTIIPGTSGSSKAQAIQVLSQDCNLSQYDSSGTTPTNVKIETINNQLVINWDKNNESLKKLAISDGVNKHEFIINNNVNEFQIPYAHFHDFSSGNGYVEIASARSSSNFSVDRETAWNYYKQIPIQITQHHFEQYKEDNINLLSFNYIHFANSPIKLKAKVNIAIKTDATVILPNGFTETYPIQSNQILETDEHNQTYFPAGSTIDIEIPTPDQGVYIVSIYNTNGEAIFNYPSYQDGIVPIIPDFLDLNQRELITETLNIENQRLRLFELINTERSKHGLDKVEIYDNLNELAQSRSDDMNERDYFSHFTPSGEDVNMIRLLYDIKTPVRENIAKDVSVEYVHEMLMRSPRHRSIILSQFMKRIGLGIAKHADGTLLITELFSEDPIEISDLSEKRLEILTDINKERIKNGVAELTLNQLLTPIAQQWSDFMATSDFCSGDSPEGENLNQRIQNSEAQIVAGISRFICHITFNDALDATLNHESALKSQFDTVGIGITQDETGIIRFTIIFADEE